MIKDDHFYALSLILKRASLKSPCLGLQEVTFIYLAWSDGLGDQHKIAFDITTFSSKPISTLF